MCEGVPLPWLVMADSGRMDADVECRVVKAFKAF